MIFLLLIGYGKTEVPCAKRRITLKEWKLEVFNSKWIIFYSKFVGGVILKLGWGFQITLTKNFQWLTNMKSKQKSEFRKTLIFYALIIYEILFQNDLNYQKIL